MGSFAEKELLQLRSGEWVELTKEHGVGPSISDTGNHLAKSPKEGRSRAYLGYWDKATGLEELATTESLSAVSTGWFC